MSQTHQSDREQQPSTGEAVKTADRGVKYHHQGGRHHGSSSGTHHEYSSYPTGHDHHHGHHEKNEYPYHGRRSKPPHVGDQVSPCPNVDETEVVRGPDPKLLQEVKSVFASVLAEPTGDESYDNSLLPADVQAVEKIFSLSPHLKHIDPSGSALEAAVLTHNSTHEDSKYFSRRALRVIVKAAVMYYDIIGSEPLSMLGPIGNPKSKSKTPKRGLQGEGQVTWAWKSETRKPDDDASAWKAYSSTESEMIESTFQEGKVSIFPMNTGYSINFETMAQFKESDPSRSRSVKRTTEQKPQAPVIKQEELEQTFTKLQCLSILSCAWLCLFPRQSARSRNAQGTLPGINFELMHWIPVPKPQGDKPAKNCVEVAKNLCILDYFDEMSQRWPESFGKLPEAHPELIAPTHAVNFVRRCADHAKHDPDTASSRKLLPVKVHPLFDSIDDMKDMIRADFANMFIGGGVCCYGAVQEEISFTICPELIVSRLVFPPMEPHEAIILVGAEQFSTIKKGTYAGSTQYGAPFKDTVSNLGAYRGVIAAIDAENYKGRDTDAQYTAESFQREYFKSLAGFDLHSSSLQFTKKFNKVGETEWQFPDAVATGNWGCGDFRGNAMYKILVQWLSCSAGGKQMHYFPFDRPELQDFEYISSCLLKRQEAGDFTWQKLYDDCIAGSFTPRLVGEKKGDAPVEKTVFGLLLETYGIPPRPTADTSSQA